MPEDYFCHLDMSGQRMDLNERPELQRGTVEFEVPEIYWTRHPSSLRVLFAVDVSYSAVHSGVLDAFCEVLKGVLFSEAAFPKGTRVGIVTFDTAVHFYNLSVSFFSSVKMCKVKIMTRIRLVNVGSSSNDGCA